MEDCRIRHQQGLIETPTDADQACLDRLTLECQRVLGPEIRIRDLAVTTNGDVLLRLSFRLDEIDWSTEGRGENIVAAHADLMLRLVMERIRLGTAALLRWRR